jgi:hypothetical protein
LTIGESHDNGAALSSVVGGLQNEIKSGADCSTIGGGEDNIICASETHAFIGAGKENIVDADCSVIVGGYSNCSQGGTWGSIVGGYDNCITNGYAFIGGGRGNGAHASLSSVVGGCNNQVTLNGYCGALVGGCGNCVNHCGGFIGGGKSNSLGRPVMSGTSFSSIVGGQLNEVTGSHAIIGGGCDNTITENAGCSGILGGSGNCINKTDAFIIGSDITAQGACITHVNSLAYYAHSDQTSYLGTSNVAGEIVYVGGTTVTAGNVYILGEPGAGTSSWLQADADSEAYSKGMLAIALGSGAANSVGMLVRGFARFTSVFSLTGASMGNPVYLSTTAGAITQTAPSGTGDIVRIIGYVIDDTTEVIYFNPDNAYVEIA